jgi:uncharacterized protein YdeI (BOF family)
MFKLRTTLAASLTALALPFWAHAAQLSTPAAAPTAVAAPASSAEAITPIGDLRRGTMVTVEGQVTRILDTDEFLIADNSGNIRVDVGYPNFVPVREGVRVKVRGFVDRDFLREIYASEIVHADGRVTSLDRRYQ